jgi:hypothetical protein
MSRAGELRLRRGVTAALVLLAGLVAAAVAYRQPIAAHLLRAQLRKLGLDRVEFSVGRFDTGLLELRNLRIGDGDNLEVASIEARFSMTGLFGSRLDTLRVSGVQLRGVLDESGPSFGDLDALLAANERQIRSSGPTALPASGIEIENAQLALETEKGPLEARLDVRVLETASGQLEGSATLSADHRQASLTIDLNAAGIPDSLSGAMKVEAAATGEWGARTTADGVSLSANAEFYFEDGDVTIRSNECAAIHVDALVVQDLAKLAEPLELCVRFRDERAIRISRDGALEANLELESATLAVDVQTGAESLRLSGELPAMTAQLIGAGSHFEVAIETTAGRLELSDPELGIRGIALVTRLSSETTVPSGRLRIREIFDPHRPPRFPNLSLDARFESQGRSIDFEIQLADAARNLVFDVSVSHDPASGTGRAIMKSEPIDFLPGGIQPADLIPALAGVITEASGSIAMVGSAKWRADATRAHLEVRVADLSVTSKMGNVDRMNAEIAIGNDGIIAIKSASWKFAGGTLSTAGAIDSLASKQDLTILVEGVDLASLATMVNLEGLSGSGTLRGEFPIFRDGNEIEIRKAKLHSVGTGDVIQYRPEASVASIGAADSQFAMTLSVLENFHYERIEIEIDGSPSGDGAVQIHLEGANPDYENGRAVAFNLSVDAELSDLLRAQTFFYRIPDLLEEQVRALAERNR